MAIDLGKNAKSKEELRQLLSANGASEVNEKEV